MIHYQLRCQAEHGFDGWFRDSGAFEAQCGAGLVSCPVCGGVNVTRALMAPALGRRREPPAQVKVQAPPEAARETPPVAAGAEPSEPPSLAGGVLPDALRALLQRMRSEVEKRCDYVGASFAEEARRIHNGESAARGIYGEATSDEAERLADDGIEVARIPWVSRAES